MAGSGKRKTLFSNAAAGTSSEVPWPGGLTSFVVEATFGSITLHLKYPSGNYVAVASTTLTANGYVNLALPPGQYKAVATGGSGYFADLIKVPE